MKNHLSSSKIKKSKGHIFFSVMLIALNLLLTSCEEESECDFVFAQVDAINTDIDALKEDLEDELISQEDYDMEIELLEFEINEIEENNPECFYN